jgi:hypothetical protein
LTKPGLLSKIANISSCLSEKFMPSFKIKFSCTTNKEHDTGLPPREVNAPNPDRALAEGRGIVYHRGLRCQQIIGRRFFIWPIRCDSKIAPEISQQE